MRTRKAPPTAAQRFGMAAKARRLELGLGLVDVAAKAKLDKGSLSRVENGRIGPRGLGIEKQERIAKALGVEIRDLVGGAHDSSMPSAAQ